MGTASGQDIEQGSPARRQAVAGLRNAPLTTVKRRGGGRFRCTRCRTGNLLGGTNCPIEQIHNILILLLLAPNT